MTAAGKSFEVRIADLVRLLGSESEGEVLNAHGALKRLLASRSVGFTDLGNAIEKLATGGLDDDQMRRLFHAGYQKGLEDSVRTPGRGASHLRPASGRNSTDWESIATYCQREKTRLEDLSIINSSTTWRPA